MITVGEYEYWDSTEHRLGRGAFADVYKGRLRNVWTLDLLKNSFKHHHNASFLQDPNKLVAIKRITKKTLNKPVGLISKEIKILKVI